MSEAFDRVATVSLSIAALVVAAVLAKREFFPTTSPASFAEGKPPVKVPDWESWKSAGVWIGDSNAPVTIVEFADFECPSCRRFHEEFVRTKAEFGDSVAILFVHFPLPYHRFSRPAARAAECAFAQGRFSQMHDLLYAQQDSFGLKAWSTLATEAGVKDTPEFEKCVESSKRIPRVERGLALGDSIRIEATPTIVINGLRYSSFRMDSLASIVKAALRSAR